MSTMNRPTVFITGGNGQVGFELRRNLSVAMDVFAPTRDELDLADAAAVDAWLKTHQPDLIVNAAAFTAVDQAESEPEAAARLNAEFPRQLANYAAARGRKIVHYSSDYVYPGDGQDPWQEDSPTAPLNVYGQTKLDGDVAVVASGAEYLIFRTSWVYSARGHNFMKTMLRLGQQKDALTIVGDQVGAPTPARLIAEVTALALHAGIDSGVYHLAPRGETSWYGFATEVFRAAREAGIQLSVTETSVTSIPTSEYPTPAARPLNSQLKLGKVEQSLQLQLPDWQTQVALTVAELLQD